LFPPFLMPWIELDGGFLFATVVNLVYFICQQTNKTT
jgi:hypothetical protein